MSHFEYHWTTIDGISIFAQRWEPSGDMKAVISLVHGIGEHSSRYEHVAQYLNAEGYALVAFDHRGHGRSEGQHGHFPNYDLLMEDLGMYLKESFRHYPDISQFLYGHSLGGNLVLNYVLRRKPHLSGAIVTAPLLKLAFKPSKIMESASRVLIKLWPTLSLKSGLKTVHISRDSEVVRAYDEDPLTHDRITPCFLKLIEAGEWALDHASQFDLPLLLMHGGEDKITSAGNTREFGNRAGECCTIKIWDGFYHEIHNEPEKEDVLKVMTNWIDNQLAK